MSSKGEHVRLRKGEIVNSEYEILECIGCGNFSKVYSALYLCDNNANSKRSSLFALKIVKREYRRDANFERKILQLLEDKDVGHRYRFCRLLRSFVWNERYVFIMPIYGPSLRERRLGFGRGVVNITNLIKLAFDLLQTLKFLHDTCHIVHTDLKPENILIEEPNPPERSLGESWVICDFGSSSVCQFDKLDSDLISTRPYRAPEVILGNHWHYAADMWSLGCILYEVAAGHRLFEVHDDYTHLQLMTKRLGKLPDILTKSSKLSCKFFNSKGEFLRRAEQQSSTKIWSRSVRETFRHDLDFCHLLLHLLAFNPEKRWTADQALHHNLFKSLRAAQYKSEELSCFVNQERIEGKELEAAHIEGTQSAVTDNITCASDDLTPTQLKEIRNSRLQNHQIAGRNVYHDDMNMTVKIDTESSNSKELIEIVSCIGNKKITESSSEKFLSPDVMTSNTSNNHLTESRETVVELPEHNNNNDNNNSSSNDNNSSTNKNNYAIDNDNNTVKFENVTTSMVSANSSESSHQPSSTASSSSSSLHVLSSHTKINKNERMNYGKICLSSAELSHNQVKHLPSDNKNTVASSVINFAEKEFNQHHLHVELSVNTEESINDNDKVDDNDSSRQKLTCSKDDDKEIHHGYNIDFHKQSSVNEQKNNIEHTFNNNKWNYSNIAVSDINDYLQSKGSILINNHLNSITTEECSDKKNMSIGESSERNSSSKFATPLETSELFSCNDDHSPVSVKHERVAKINEVIRKNSTQTLHCDEHNNVVRNETKKPEVDLEGYNASHIYSNYDNGCHNVYKNKNNEDDNNCYHSNLLKESDETRKEHTIKECNRAELSLLEAVGLNSNKSVSIVQNLSKILEHKAQQTTNSCDIVTSSSKLCSDEVNSAVSNEERLNSQNVKHVIVYRNESNQIVIHRSKSAVAEIKEKTCTEPITAVKKEICKREQEKDKGRLQRNLQFHTPTRRGSIKEPNNVNSTKVEKEQSEFIGIHTQELRHPSASAQKRELCYCNANTINSVVLSSSEHANTREHEENNSSDNIYENKNRSKTSIVNNGINNNCNQTMRKVVERRGRISHDMTIEATDEEDQQQKIPVIPLATTSSLTENCSCDVAACYTSSSNKETHNGAAKECQTEKVNVAELSENVNVVSSKHEFNEMTEPMRGFYTERHQDSYNEHDKVNHETCLTCHKNSNDNNIEKYKQIDTTSKCIARANLSKLQTIEEERRLTESQDEEEQKQLEIAPLEMALARDDLLNDKITCNLMRRNTKTDNTANVECINVNKPTENTMVCEIQKANLTTTSLKTDNNQNNHHFASSISHNVNSPLAPPLPSVNINSKCEQESQEEEQQELILLQSSPSSQELLSSSSLLALEPTIKENEGNLEESASAQLLSLQTDLTTSSIHSNDYSGAPRRHRSWSSITSELEEQGSVTVHHNFVISSPICVNAESNESSHNELEEPKLQLSAERRESDVKVETLNQEVKGSPKESSSVAMSTITINNSNVIAIPNKQNSKNDDHKNLCEGEAFDNHNDNSNKIEKNVQVIEDSIITIKNVNKYNNNINSNNSNTCNENVSKRLSGKLRSNAPVLCKHPPTGIKTRAFPQTTSALSPSMKEKEKISFDDIAQNYKKIYSGVENKRKWLANSEVNVKNGVPQSLKSVRSFVTAVPVLNKASTHSTLLESSWTAKNGSLNNTLARSTPMTLTTNALHVGLRSAPPPATTALLRESEKCTPSSSISVNENDSIADDRQASRLSRKFTTSVTGIVHGEEGANVGQISTVTNAITDNKCTYQMSKEQFHEAAERREEYKEEKCEKCRNANEVKQQNQMETLSSPQRCFSTLESRKRSGTNSTSLCNFASESLLSTRANESAVSFASSLSSSASKSVTSLNISCKNRVINSANISEGRRLASKSIEKYRNVDNAASESWKGASKKKEDAFVSSVVPLECSFTPISLPDTQKVVSRRKIARETNETSYGSNEYK